jgi:hypothetical protein
MYKVTGMPSIVISSRQVSIHWYAWKLALHRCHATRNPADEDPSAADVNSCMQQQNATGLIHKGL